MRTSITMRLTQEQESDVLVQFPDNLITGFKGPDLSSRSPFGVHIRWKLGMLSILAKKKRQNSSMKDHACFGKAHSQAFQYSKVDKVTCHANMEIGETTKRSGSGLSAGGWLHECRG